MQKNIDISPPTMKQEYSDKIWVATSRDASDRRLLTVAMFLRSGGNGKGISALWEHLGDGGGEAIRQG